MGRKSRAYSALELFSSNPDQPDLRAARILSRVEERREEPRGPGIQRLIARDVLARGVRAGQGPEVSEADGDGDRAASAEALAQEPREDFRGQRPDPLQDEV